MSKKEIVKIDAAAPNPNLSPATTFGNLVFVAGQTGSHPDTGELGKDIREQTRQTLANLTRILSAAGLSMANVVNMRVVLRNTEDFAAFNESFREFMAGEKVTRTCIGGTPHRKGVNIEIDCIASFE